MNRQNKKEIKEIIYPKIQFVLNSNTDEYENPASLEPIYFDWNVLCCPYCSNRDLRKGGTKSNGTKTKRLFTCKRKDCGARFTHPEDRKSKPPRRYTRILKSKYYDPNVLCCPECGNQDLWKKGLNQQGKQFYQCKDQNCHRRFIDPALRIKYEGIPGIVCRFCGGTSCRRGNKNPKGEKIYDCRDCGRSFLPGATVEYYPRLTVGEDVWDAKALGYKVEKNRNSSKFNFATISQFWLKELAKKFIKLRVDLAFSTLNHYIKSFNHFSRFLNKHYPDISSIEEIDRDTIIDYRSYLISLKTINNGGINKAVTNIKKFIEAGNVNGWFKTKSCLFLKEDNLKEKVTTPRYIPDYILKQFNKHKKQLIAPVRRMVSVFQATGVRYSTLSTIPFDCLEKDNQDRWWLNFTRVKVPIKERFPIVDKELLEEILEQQSFIREHFDDNEFLFTAREGGKTGTENDPIFIPKHNVAMHRNSFATYLNKLSTKCDIRDENGQIYYITSHQFRHTFGTEAINNGVPQHIVQRLLGHTTPEMTMRYAHIFDETLITELNKFHQNRTIDIAGQIIDLQVEGDPKSLEWFTQEISAIALPNGYCGRARIYGDCDIAGDIGCYICPHFRTSKAFLHIHKDQLLRVTEILEKATKYNWGLAMKKNKPIKQNLELIITILEKEDNEQE